MDTRCSRLCALLASTLVVLQTPALAQAPESRTSDLRQYTFSQLVADRYEVVGRLWGGDTWRSAFALTTFATREQAVAALNNEAAARGADALLNVYCLDQGRSQMFSSKEPAILCYAIAIRVKPS